MIYEFQIILQLPGKALNPNSRTHWGAKAKAAKELREEAQFVTETELRSLRKKLAQGDLNMACQWDHVFVKPIFFFKDKRRRDKDNCSASLKSARDGICDAMKVYGYATDDDNFVPMPPEIKVDKNLPRVEITVCRDLD